MGDQAGYVIFEAGWGWVGVLGSAEGVKRLILPQPSPEAALRWLGVHSGSSGESLFPDLIAHLKAYFRGERVEFTDSLDFAGATDFQRRVWMAARLIPYGETASYGWLAGVIGQPEAVRAVGQALARNPVSIMVPCHRVISGNGRLGGFSGGLAIKRRLLGLEGVNLPG